MEKAPILTALLEKRAEIEAAIAELERQIRRHKADMVQLDATIGMFAPSVTAARRGATKFKRSAHFLTGELTRLCLDSLREAEGRPITAHEIAVKALHQKGLDAGDEDLRMDFTRRIAWTLSRMHTKGTVSKQGWGAKARWGLPDHPT
jgi:hypothetical protein